MDECMKLLIPRGFFLIVVKIMLFAEVLMKYHFACLLTICFVSLLHSLVTSFMLVSLLGVS